jgi:hypothetical protein
MVFLIEIAGGITWPECEQLAWAIAARTGISLLLLPLDVETDSLLGH